MIVDGHPSMCWALTALISEHLGQHAVSAVPNVKQAVSDMATTAPRVVITELWFDGPGHGSDLCRFVKGLPQCPHVMVFSANTEAQEVAAMVAAGADSFVHKSTPVAGVIDAIERTIQGERVWKVDERYLNSQHSSPISRSFSPFTAREEEVLKLILDRRTNAEIAEELTLARQTVKNHVSRVLQKTGVNSRQELFSKSAAR